jgi:hypothetical protein
MIGYPSWIEDISKLDKYYLNVSIINGLLTHRNISISIN